MLQRAVAGVASKFGSSAAKANLDVNKDVITMKKDLAGWMAGSGIAKGTLSVEDFIDFLGKKGLPTDFVNSSMQAIRRQSGTPDESPLTNPEVDELLKKASQAGFKSQGSTGAKSRYAAKTPTPADNPPAQGQGAPDITNFVNSLTPQQKAKLKASL
jgi:hypothetical protein